MAKRSISKISNELVKLTNDMKSLAKKWKAGDDSTKKKIASKLGPMTKQKKKLEKELDDAVTGIDKDIELQMTENVTLMSLINEDPVFKDPNVDVSKPTPPEGNDVGEDVADGVEDALKKMGLEFKKQADQLVAASPTDIEESKLNEAGIITAAGIALSMPVLMKIIGSGLKVMHKVTRQLKGKDEDPDSLGQGIIDAADKLHHKFMVIIEWPLKPFIKDKTKRHKVADYIFHAILLLLLVDAGVGIYKGFQAANVNVSNLSMLSTKSGIKASEMGQRIARSETMLPKVIEGLSAMLQKIKAPGV